MRLPYETSELSRIDFAAGDDQPAGECTGIIDGIGYLGGALSVWMAGELSDRLGWSQVFVLLSAFAALSMFAAMLMSRHYKKEARYMGVKS